MKSEVRNSRRRCAHTSGFTIIELLVVIGIIVLLAGLLIPMVMKAYRQGDRTRIAADLNAIATALEAYRNDFGDYPRVDTALERGTGFAVLTKALVGGYGDGLTTGATPVNDQTDPPQWLATERYSVGQCVQTSATEMWVAIADSTNSAPAANFHWRPFNPRDGADGEGFRVRAMGQIKPAYLQSGKVKVRGSAMLDHHDHPILYFPQSPVKVNLNVTTGANPGYYVAAATAAIRPMYNFDDNAELAVMLTPEADESATGLANAMFRMRMLLGDYADGPGTGPPDGLINSKSGFLTDVPATTGPYILWSVGPDGYFGSVQIPSTIPLDDRRKAADKCDDVIHK